MRDWILVTKVGYQHTARARINVACIEGYWSDDGRGKCCLVLASGSEIDVLETPEEIDQLIFAATAEERISQPAVAEILEAVGK